MDKKPAEMLPTSLPEVPSLRARADAMRKATSRYAHILGRDAESSGETLDGLVMLMVLPTEALLSMAPNYTPFTPPEVERDPHTLEVISPDYFGPLKPELPKTG